MQIWGKEEKMTIDVLKMAINYADLPDDTIIRVVINSNDDVIKNSLDVEKIMVTRHGQQNAKNYLCFFLKENADVGALKVVRCRECRLGTHSGIPGMIHCANNNMEHRPDCYCSYGVRKGG